MVGDNMMKKEILFIIFIVLTGCSTELNGVSKINSESTFQTIPDDAIRLRILANSDSEQDQYIKRIVRDEVNEFITVLVEEIDNIEEARELIADNVPKIQHIVQETLNKLEVSDSFTVEYSSNVTFPMKVYDNFVYPAGEYEAVLISIGEGKGSNWWCVLFPPLCFLDFSNGSTVAEASEDKAETVEDDDSLVESDDDDSFSEDDLENHEDLDDIENADADEVEVKFFLFEWLGLS